MDDSILLQRSHRSLRKNETNEDAIRSLTHLHMNSLTITHFENMNRFSSAQVLYAYDNQIQSIDGIQNLDLLQEAQLQYNQIASIPPLQPLHLHRLDLRHNVISKIENLESQSDLEELYLSFQGVESVELTPNCFAGISEKLEVLEVASCGLSDLTQLLCFTNLKRLDLSGNRITDFLQLSILLPQLDKLESLDLRGNPICSEMKYREQVIILGKFKELDEREVLETQRETLIRMKQRKVGKPKASQKASEPNPLSVIHLM